MDAEAEVDRSWPNLEAALNYGRHELQGNTPTHVWPGWDKGSAIDVDSGEPVDGAWMDGAGDAPRLLRDHPRREPMQVAAAARLRSLHLTLTSQRTREGAQRIRGAANGQRATAAEDLREALERQIEEEVEQWIAPLREALHAVGEHGKPDHRVRLQAAP